MRITIKTRVEQDFRKVFQAFDFNLFMKLKPPLVSLKVMRFDGSSPGDVVHVEINVLGLKQEWISEITERIENTSECYFVDEGTLLPKPLEYWQHRHIIKKSIDSSIIIDDICYKSGNILVEFLLFPAFFMQFFLRKHVYKSYFRN